MPAGQEISPGVTEIDHTADVGIEIEAGSRAELFDRAARGTVALLEGREGAPPDTPAEEDRAAGRRRLELRADGPDLLLVRWLREILYVYEVEGLAYREATFETLEDDGLRADVRLRPRSEAPELELKGVTYHGLEVGRRGGEWYARVIFDV